MDTESAVLSGQLEYYRRRAPEYDEWWQRLGRYDQGRTQREEWEAQVAELERALEAFGPTGDVLELAGGTGWWTERLARSARTLTVVDAAPETLAINRRRVPARPGLAYVVVDLFAWEPNRRFDVVFFSFWLSHVPRARFGPFWDMVARCLRPGGRVFLIDSRPDPFWGPGRNHEIAAESDELQDRRLNDGSEHRVVKIYYEPAELASLLSEQGWSTDLSGTTLFTYGSARPKAGEEH